MNLDGKSRCELCTAHCVHHLPFPDQAQLCEIKLRKWVKKWMWTSLPKFVWFILLKNLWLSFCLCWMYCTAWSTASGAAIRTVSLLGYGMAVGWPGQRLVIPEDELKVKEALCHTTICYPNAMGLAKQTFWLFLCVRVKFMFPTVALCPSLRLHTKVCKRVQWKISDLCHLRKKGAL